MRLFGNISIRTLFLLIGAVMVLSACNSDKHLKKGEQYWAIGEYYEASLEFAKAYAKTPASEKDRRGMIAYKVAESNRMMNYFAKAQAGYRNAVRYKYTDTLTYFYLAEMERYNKEYKQAAKDYQMYLETHPRHRLSLIGLEASLSAQDFKERGSSYTVKEDKNFNSNYMDFAPAFNGEDIYFSSTRRDCNGDDINGVTGMLSGDIFYMQKDDKGKWKRYESVDETVNSKFDEGACAFTPDGKTMYFTRCRWDASYPRMAEIFSSQRSDAAWGEAKVCQLSKDTLSSYAHPAVSPKGDYLYFVSDMPGGYGGLDLWRVTLNGGSFGPVENLGADINTEADEMFPTFRPNGDLYFSTKGRGGMGGLDIFMARQDSVTQKWELTHLPYPVNSNGDDFGMTFSGEHNEGFFSSNRANRRGWDKIYSFYCPDVIQTVKGWVYEQDGYELATATVYMVGDDGTNKKLTPSLDGSFTETIKPGVKYLFLATCEGHMNVKQELEVEPVLESEEYTLQFPLPSLDIPVLVRNVFYEFDKAVIMPQSIPALEGLVNLLKQNPSIAIELSSHCDYRGSDEYNQKLSQARAESVVHYLITHGIPKERVVAKGYGKSRPKVITKKFAEKYPFLHENDTLSEAFITQLPAEQQDSCNALNRRTEFSVLKTTFGLVDDKGNLNPDAVKKAAADTTATKPAASPEKPESSAAKSDASATKPDATAAKPDASAKKPAEPVAKPTNDTITTAPSDTVATKSAATTANQKAADKASAQSKSATTPETKKDPAAQGNKNTSQQKPEPNKATKSEPKSEQNKVTEKLSENAAASTMLNAPGKKSGSGVRRLNDRFGGSKPKMAGSSQGATKSTEPASQQTTPASQQKSPATPQKTPATPQKNEESR